MKGREPVEPVDQVYDESEEDSDLVASGHSMVRAGAQTWPEYREDFIGADGVRRITHFAAGTRQAKLAHQSRPGTT